MEVLEQKHVNRFQIILEQVLGIWAFAIAVFHILLATFRYIISYEDYTGYLQWATVGLLITSLLYLIGSVVASKSARERVVLFLQKCCSFEWFLLVGILIWFIISCYANGKALRYPEIYFYFHDWYLFDMAVCVLILFPFVKVLGVERTKKVIEILVHIVVITYSVFTIVCLWHIFHLEVLTFPSGEQGGMTVNVQLMLGKHYNLTGMIAITMLCLCVYMVFTQTDKVIRSIYVVMGIIQLVVVYLCNSRTVFVGAIAFVGVTAFFYPWYRLREKKILVRIAVCLGIAGCSVLLFWAGRKGMFILFESITHFNEELAKEISASSSTYSPVMLSAGRIPEYHTAFLAASGEENVRNLTDLAGRNYIWKAALKVMDSSSEAYYFGVTPIEVTDAMKNIGGLSGEYAHAHNSVLQFGVGMGMPSMVMFVAFLVSIAIRCVRLLFRGDAKLTPASYLIPASILAFVVIGMAEAYLTAYFSVMECFFFLFCGWVVALDGERIEKTENKKTANRSLALNVGCAIVVSFSCVLLFSMYSTRYFHPTIEHFKGSGTQNDPYIIKNASDLKYFRDLVNNGNNLEGYYFLQTEDINLRSREWMPIGIDLSEKYFEGVYDGGCHCIENLSITKKYPYYPRNVGFFGVLNGTVKNLGIKSGSISGANVAAVASHSREKAIIINCYNKASVDGFGRAGGIIDHFSGGTVMCCINEGVLIGPITADICSYTVGNLWANDDEKNITENFSGTFHPLKMEGETVDEKLNAGLEELIAQGVIDRDDVRFW